MKMNRMKAIASQIDIEKAYAIKDVIVQLIKRSSRQIYERLMLVFRLV